MIASSPRFYFFGSNWCLFWKMISIFFDRIFIGQNKIECVSLENIFIDFLEFDNVSIVKGWHFIDLMALTALLKYIFLDQHWYFSKLKRVWRGWNFEIIFDAQYAVYILNMNILYQHDEHKKVSNILQLFRIGSKMFQRMCTNKHVQLHHLYAL